MVHSERSIFLLSHIMLIMLSFDLYNREKKILYILYTNSSIKYSGGPLPLAPSQGLLTSQPGGGGPGSNPGPTGLSGRSPSSSPHPLLNPSSSSPRHNQSKRQRSPSPPPPTQPSPHMLAAAVAAANAAAQQQFLYAPTQSPLLQSSARLSPAGGPPPPPINPSPPLSGSSFSSPSGKKIRQPPPSQSPQMQQQQRMMPPQQQSPSSSSQSAFSSYMNSRPPSNVGFQSPSSHKSSLSAGLYIIHLKLYFSIVWYCTNDC